MVDGVIVLVDASEAAAADQVRRVEGAQARLRPIVAINKIDRPDERHLDVLNEIFDLFANLDASDEQLDFPVLYGSGRNGWMALDPAGPQESGTAVRARAEPCARRRRSRTARASARHHARGRSVPRRILTGRITSGTVRPNQTMKALSRDGRLIETFRVQKVLAFRGLERTAVEVAEAGDIVAIAGMKEANVADTLCDPTVGEPLPAQPVDPPTLSMTFRINDGPFAARRATRCRAASSASGCSRRRSATSPSASADPTTRTPTVAGRGELQLAILIENMRREGFRADRVAPKVVYEDPATGQRLEPIEEVIIDVDDAHTGVVVSTLSERKGELVEMRPSGGGARAWSSTCPPAACSATSRSSCPTRAARR